ncbi:MAG: glycosyltransferase, partial [Bacillota bacterium]|nr:glycosyltransferase [Bacillota bacterium]
MDEEGRVYLAGDFPLDRWCRLLVQRGLPVTRLYLFGRLYPRALAAEEVFPLPLPAGVAVELTGYRWHPRSAIRLVRGLAYPLEAARLAARSDLAYIKLPSLGGLAALLLTPWWGLGGRHRRPRGVRVAHLVGEGWRALEIKAGPVVGPLLRSLAERATAVALKRADLCVFVSEAARRRFRLRADLPAVVANESKLSREDLHHSRPAALHSPPRLLYVGRLAPEKGVHVLLQAFTTLRRERDVELWLVGDGPQRRELETLAAGLGLSSSVRFYGRRPWREVLWRWMRE